MRLRELHDIYAGQDIYIVGSGPTASVFPMDFLYGKVCISLNDAYKMHPAIGPVAYMNHQTYAHAGTKVNYDYHEHMNQIRYPVVKATGWDQRVDIDWDHPFYYYFNWSHEIESIWDQQKDTDDLIFMRDGPSLHAALQLAWIMGAANIFTIGCDSTTLGGKHYAGFDKNGFRDDEQLKRGIVRNYDAYVCGTLVIKEFLRRKGVNVFNLSPIIGYHMVDYQFSVLNGEIGLDDAIQKGRAFNTQPEGPQGESPLEKMNRKIEEERLAAQDEKEETR